ncbi:MAG: hypothetical protein HN368_11635, partial [Spirochaetales bacterium]|nr:hypothetical protein [Spirochaetales bacterium]
KDAPILLLDEPTSSLDAEAEARIQRGIQRLLEMGKTVVVAAHRLSTIKHADRILVINNGTIVEQGSHEVLMNADGLYRQLYQTQFDQFQEGRDGIAK